MKKTKKAKKNASLKFSIVLICMYALFAIAKWMMGIAGDSGSGNTGGHEKVLGMTKSAVDKKYGKPVELPDAMGGHGAYMYSDKFSVHYTEDGKADYMELGIGGKAFGLKLGDDPKTVDKALEKYGFEFVSMDDSIEYENSEYVIFLTPNEVKVISEFSIGSKELRDSSSDSSDYAADSGSSNGSSTSAESSDSIDYAGVLGMDKRDVDAYFGDPVADSGKNAYQYSDLGVSYDGNNKAVYVAIGGRIGSGGQIMGLKIGDSMETVEKVLAEYGFSFVGTTPDSPDDYEYVGTDYFVIVRYNGYQKATLISLSIL